MSSVSRLGRLAPWQPWVTLLARLGLAVVFLWAGLPKFTDLAASQRSVRLYEILPNNLANIAGIVLPIVETTIGLLLLAGLLSRWVAAAGGALLVVFVGGIISAWARGLNIDCGCFAPGSVLPPGQNANYGGEIARDVGFLALAVIIILWPRSRFSADSGLGLVAPPSLAVSDRDEEPDLSAIPGITIRPTEPASSAAGDQTIRVDSFLDFMCPFCRRFVAEQAAELQRLVDAGQIEWIIHPVAFLDELSRDTEYSARAASAAFQVADGAPELVRAFVAALFARQPRERSAGLSDAEIAGIAVEVGVPDDVARLISDRAFGITVDEGTIAAIDWGVENVPVIVLTAADGEVTEWDQTTPLVDLLTQPATV